MISWPEAAKPLGICVFRRKTRLTEEDSGPITLFCLDFLTRCKEPPIIYGSQGTRTRSELSALIRLFNLINLIS